MARTGDYGRDGKGEGDAEYTRELMTSFLSDLVNGGCVEEGSEALNNPLSRLSKQILEAGRRSDLAGGGSSQMHAALPSGPGPSSSSGLLPAMDRSTADFLHAVEHDTTLQHGWDASAVEQHAMPPPHHLQSMPMPPPPYQYQFMPPPPQHILPPGFAEVWDEAGAAAAHAPLPPPTADAHAAMLSQQTGMGPLWPAPMPFGARPLPPPPLPPPRFAGPAPTFMRHMPTASAMATLEQPPSYSLSAHDARHGPPEGALTAQDVSVLDAAHEEAWRALAAGREAPAVTKPAPVGNPRSVVSELSAARDGSTVRLPRGDSNTSMARAPASTPRGRLSAPWLPAAGGLLPAAAAAAAVAAAAAAAAAAPARCLTMAQPRTCNRRLCSRRRTRRPWHAALRRRARRRRPWHARVRGRVS
ncbi:hypothetical protein OAO87_02845 [bacterium]|nr:hypothetical protein [bacterium]